MLGVNGEFASYNLFAYCGNNPVNRVDRYGHFWEDIWEVFTQLIQQASGILAFAGGVTQLDSPFPGPADIVGGAIAGLTMLACLGIATYTTLAAHAPIITFSRQKEKTKAIEKVDSTPIFVYRHNGTNPSNLVPTNSDVRFNSGLSFSTIPKRGSWQK